MKYEDYTWDKEFEIKGYFSELPGDIINNSLSGILHYSPSEIILELFGAFDDDTKISFGFGKYLEKIYGFSNNGNILILDTYGEPMGHFSTPGFAITKYRVKNFKIYKVFYNELEKFDSTPKAFGDLIDKLDNGEVKEFKFSFDHIEEWIEKSLVNFKHKENQDVFESTLNEYQSTKVLINSLAMNFEDTAILHSSYATTSFKSNYFIKLTSADLNIKYFDEFYNASRKFIEFIEILSNVPISYTNIEFLVHYKVVEEKIFPLIRGKFFVQHARKFKKWNKFSQQNISLRRLEDDFEQILNHWFDKSEKLEFIVRQFSKNLHGDLYLEDQLVDAIRNLEVYSRNFIKLKIPQDLSDSEKQSREVIYNFIDKFICEDDREKLRKKLAFKSRSPILSERLRNLFDSIDEIDQTKIFPKSIDRDLLITKLTQTRNYHTHGDTKDKYPNMITNINEMYETKVLLQEVLRYYIYQELEMKYGFQDFYK